MGDDTVRTGVDELLSFLQGKDRVSMQEAATALKVPMDTVQSWTDFLVEEKILGIEYKFTKPYIYLNKEEKKTKNQIVEHTTVPLDQVKREYFERARTRHIPEQKIQDLWKQRIAEALSSRKIYFLEQASKRNAPNALRLWEAYQQDLLARS